MEDSLRRCKDFKALKSYASLLETPYAAPVNMSVPEDPPETTPSGFPAPREEAHYLENLDSYLNGVASTSRSSGALAGRAADRSSERDRETALKNPVSVYNWLRKHQPQVFLQDNEPQAEKPSARSATSRASKRGSTAAVKQEPDLYDEDGIAIDMGSTSRGKRKRDDDGGYRPKGGNGRPSKRKREDGSKKSKRAPQTTE